MLSVIVWNSRQGDWIAAAPDTLGLRWRLFGAVLGDSLWPPCRRHSVGAVLSGTAAILLVMLVSRTGPENPAPS